MLTQRRTAPPNALIVIAAAVWLWLPIEFHLLPPLRVPPVGYDAGPLLGILLAFYLFVFARPLDGVGCTFRLTVRDAGIACLAVAVYAVAALPIGLATGFLTWNPRVSSNTLFVTPLLIYVLTALPEELLFRGVFQNVFTRWWGRWLALVVASIVFGLAHLPDPRYVALAALAGIAYGLVYAKTGKITASALTHAGVDWIWVLLLR